MEGVHSTGHSTYPEKCRTYESAIVWIGIGMAGWLGSGHVGRLALSPGDPGPWLVPRAASTLLVAMGCIQLVQSIFAGRRTENTTAKDSGSRSLSHTFLLRQLLLVGGITIYVLVIPIIGFTISSILAVTWLLRFQSSKWRWWSAILVTIALVVYVHVFFYYLLSVPLPEGMWWNIAD